MKSDLLKEIKLLYVEDDVEIRAVLSRGLQRRVKELIVAVDGKDGVEKYKEFQPDIILTDIKMPKMNGIEMSRKIKELNSQVPIIIMSAHSETDYLLESIAIGVNGYLLKPVDKDRLFEALSTNAKDILFEKAIKEQKMLLQEVIDLQPSIIFSSDEQNRILFINKSFTEFFCCDKELELDTLKDKSILEFLEQRCNSDILKSKIEDKLFLEYLLENPNNEALDREIKVDDKSYNFIIKSKQIDFENEQKYIVMTLTKKEK